MKAKKALKTADFQMIGQRHASEDVATETSEASRLWERDVEVLALLGFGPEALAEYQALRDQHGRYREARPETVAHKKGAVQTKDKLVASGWLWVDMVNGILGRLAREDEAVANRLAEALPSDDSELGDKIGAMAALLTSVKDRVPASAKADERIAEAMTLKTTLASAPGELAIAKAAPITDTAEIDVLDGKLYIRTRDLYESARKAIRHGKLSARTADYTFKHLNQSVQPARPTNPTPPVTPV